MRIGHGYDVHRIKAGGPLILGGVAIDCGLSLAAHSDGDVLIHALIDALFGAAGMADIGVHFPDSDDAYLGADSKKLLGKTVALLRESSFEIEYADVTVVAQRPKLAPHIGEMKKTLAETMGIGEDRINVKATTEEGLGFTGNGEGIAAHAVCLLRE